MNAATSTAPERRDWTTIGERFAGQRVEFEAAVAGLTWLSPVPATLPMVPGLGVEAAIRELRIPKVSAVAVDGGFEVPDGPETASFGVYGIEGNYRNARVRVYVVDSGCELTPVAMDVWPFDDEEEAA